MKLKLLILSITIFSLTFFVKAQDDSRLIGELNLGSPVSTTFNGSLFTDFALMYQFPFKLEAGLEYSGGHLIIDNGSKRGVVSSGYLYNKADIRKSDADMDMLRLKVAYIYQPDIHALFVPFVYAGRGMYRLNLQTVFIDDKTISATGYLNHITFAGMGFRYYLTDPLALKVAVEYDIPESRYLDSDISSKERDTFLMIKVGLCFEYPASSKKGYRY